MAETFHEDGLLTADEAARRLNVKRATVYAYVSRGLLERKTLSGATGSFFDAMEVERLADRGRKGRRPGRLTPTFRSAITTSHRGELYYRGRRACSLAVSERYEDVAHLLWEDRLDRGSVFRPDQRVAAMLREVGGSLPSGVLPFDRARAFVPVAATMDPMRHDLNGVSVTARVSRLMATLVAAMPTQSPLPDTGEGGDIDFANRLWSALSPSPPSDDLVRILNAVLVLTADADVTSPTTVAARLGASVGADIYSVIAAGMHCSGGPVQSASSLAVESYLGTFDGRGSVGEIIGERLRQGQALPGFGHHRFPEGDRRAALILDMLARSDGPPARVERLGEFLDMQKTRGLPPPNIGFAIAALAYVSGMVRGSGDLIFAIARTAGWAAHAIEQYNSGVDLPRPPSLYIGRSPLPDSADASPATAVRR